MVSILIKIHGVEARIRAHVYLERLNADSPWDYGRCVVSTTDEDSPEWNFSGRLIDDGIVVTPELGRSEYQYAQPGPGPHQHD